MGASAWIKGMAPVLAGALKLMASRQARKQKKERELYEINKRLEDESDPSIGAMLRRRWWLRRDNS